MSLSNPIWVVGVFFLLLFLGALVYGVMMQRRGGDPDPVDAPDWARSVSAPMVDERMASIVSEHIEELVQQQISKDPSLEGVKIDFGTSTDGGLEIWIDEERFSDIDSIPDERIRTMIRHAVEAYNKGKTV
jgi:hypothetical protein